MSRVFRVSFTGHRPDKFGGYNETSPRIVAVKEALRTAIGSALACHEPTSWITGGALGLDTWAAETVLSLNQKLILAIPFEGFDSKWPAASRARLAGIREQAAFVKVVCPSFSNAAYQTRNEYMVDNSSLLIAAWDGSSGGTRNCVTYAKKVERPVINILEV